MISIKKIMMLWFFVTIDAAAQGTYYNSINPTASSFITDLETRIRSPYTRISYDNYKMTIIPDFESRDTTYSRKVITCIYSGLNYVYTPPFAWIGSAGVNADSGFSREHTWCQSWMPTVNASGFTNMPEYSDQHHLFPVNQNKANGVRNNHPLGNVVTPSSTYLNGTFGVDANGKAIYEPRGEHKGDAARALLYMTVRYNGVSGYTWTFNNLNRVLVDSLSEAGINLSTLLQWHQQDPPNKWEVDRNNYIETQQGNRNPFVDHPEYVEYINFGDLTKLNPSYSNEPTNQPTNITTSAPSASSITVNWTNAAAGTQSPSGYLIEIYNSNDYFIPMDGQTYPDDLTINDSKGLINVVNSATTSYTFTGLDCGTNYYIRMYAYNGSGSSINYKIDGTIGVVSGSTSSSSLASEPTNYPSGFNTPGLTTNSITITWTDPTGTVLPTGYLIFANNSNIFTDPTDGITYNDNIDLSDFLAQVNVPLGVQQYTFTNLLPATSYSFRLYPYNGNGCQRNYKISAFPQTLSVLYSTTSSGGGSIPDVVINEYFNGSVDTLEWIELLVLKDSLNMQGMKIRDYSSSGSLLNVNTPLQFLSIPEWESVRHGTFIVIYTPNSTVVEDLDFSDKKIIIKSKNSNFFSYPSSPFSIAGTADAIEIYNAANTHIHSLSHGSQPGLIASIPQPRGNISGSSTSGNVVRFFNTSSITQFNDNSYVQHSGTATMGTPNDATQTTFITTVLPVELVSFSAIAMNSNVVLNWSTVTEVNNYGFEIEKNRIQKTDDRNQNKADEWMKIGFVKGNGTTNAPKAYSFIDNSIVLGNYSYRLKQIDRDGEFEYSKTVEVTVGNNPTSFELFQNYPNPFNPTTMISYQLPVNSHIQLRVYDVIGRKVAELVNGVKEAGYYSIQFDASKLSTGLYIVHFEYNGKTQMRKMLLIK